MWPLMLVIVKYVPSGVTREFDPDYALELAESSACSWRAILSPL
jgi:hypothetical protein